MEFKPLLLFSYLLLIFLFSLLSEIIHKQPGVRRTWGRGSGSFSLRAEVNVKSMLIHYLNTA